jgi:hypothetical protein
MMDVKIEPLFTVGQDERGQTLSFSIRETANFIYITRKKGSISGNTYHQGKSKYTNPKIFILLSGAIKLSYRRVGEEISHEVIVDLPSTIAISPYVTHSVEAIEDFSLLECNAISDIENDRIREPVIKEMEL